MKFVLFIFLNVVGVFSCYYIFCIILEWVWVNDSKSFILINKVGEILYYLEDLCYKIYFGFYVVNREDELFYIDEEYNIIKLLRDMDRVILFIKIIVLRRKF